MQIHQTHNFISLFLIFCLHLGKGVWQVKMYHAKGAKHYVLLCLYKET